MSVNYSMIDAQLCRYLHLDLTPFQYDVPLCTGIEEAYMTKSIEAILGWVELEIGILGPGLATVRFDNKRMSCMVANFSIHTWREKMMLLRNGPKPRMLYVQRFLMFSYL